MQMLREPVSARKPRPDIYPAQEIKRWHKGIANFLWHTGAYALIIPL